MTRSVAIFGSTGSIGRQTLDVIRQEPDEYRVIGLAANSNPLIVEQAGEFHPKYIHLSSSDAFHQLSENFGSDVTVLTGDDTFDTLIDAADLIMNAVVGFAGLAITLLALQKGKKVALANKESMVAGADLVRQALLTPGAELIPVDSEHSAIFQSLQGGPRSAVKEIVLTSSGGPFRGKKKNELANVTVQDALGHPKWDMGAKITIDSSTMMNKGLEIIEAHELFNVAYEDIRVVVHPQAIVHSAVTYSDGSTIAQMSQPDMTVPISYALAYPNRSATSRAAIDWTEVGSLEFHDPDRSVFTALDLAVEAGQAGGTAPTVLNAANEVSVQAFLDGLIPWLEIVDVVRDTLSETSVQKADDIEAVMAADSEARQTAQRKIKQMDR